MLVVMLWHDAFKQPDDFIDLNDLWIRPRLASLPSLYLPKPNLKTIKPCEERIIIKRLF